VTAAIRDTDRGLLARLAALRTAERDAARWEVVVGVLAEKGGGERTEAGELTVLDLATIHEFGAPAAGIPQRSFVRAFVDAHAATIRGWQRTLFAQVTAGRLDVRQALEQLGAKVAGGIQAYIAQGIAPPNAPATVERKGSSTPLIDSGQLRSSITYTVRPKGGG
jgi:hypothetical protein